ncbi:hypothetical protein [Tenacibaculum ovolyticum]|uniref:hypothetical protein n=1 Tax=Tenacibaculum ovolyticum TaxID=104270 RepID=UPI001F48E3CF|nr:hypothetical protein [Tenacibaculum ovolyticum]
MNKFSLLDEATYHKLFKTNSGIVEYVVIEEELNDLFDFCMLLQESTLQKINNLSNDCKEYEKEPNKSLKYDGIEFSNNDIIHGIKDFEIPSWNGILEFTVPMNQILLLSILIEKSLKSLCAEYSPNNHSTYYGGYDIKIRKKSQESTISSYIKYLEKNCEIKNISDTTIEYLNQNLRTIRNSFVHGDWNTIEKFSNEIDINQVFISASVLFYNIESKYTKKT